VDTRPYRTAQELAALAITPEERRFGREAVRLADYDLDLAFVSALREAKERAPAPTPGSILRLPRKVALAFAPGNFTASAGDL
jgi:hypothetical protein